MKVLFLSIIVLLFSSLAYSVDYRADSCLDIEQKARIIMQARQLGFPIQEVFDPEGREVYKYIVADAYQIGMIKSEYYRTIEVIHFSKTWYYRCMEHNSV